MRRNGQAVWISLLGVLVCAPGCERPESVKEAAKTEAAAEEKAPLLPLKTGDWWRYEVTTEGAADSGEVARAPRVRRYLGKVEPGNGLADADGFEVTTIGMPQVLEFMDIDQDSIVLRGTEEVGGDGLRWLGNGVPIYRRGLKSGEGIAFTSADAGSGEAGEIGMNLSVVGEERLETPAGNFDAVKLLLLARSELGETRRTLWFSPGNGFIQEENVYYNAEVRVRRETVILQASNRELVPAEAR